MKSWTGDMVTTSELYKPLWRLDSAMFGYFEAVAIMDEIASVSEVVARWRKIKKRRSNVASHDAEWEGALVENPGIP